LVYYTKKNLATLDGTDPSNAAFTAPSLHTFPCCSRLECFYKFEIFCWKEKLQQYLCCAVNVYGAVGVTHSRRIFVGHGVFYSIDIGRIRIRDLFVQEVTPTWASVLISELFSSPKIQKYWRFWHQILDINRVNFFQLFWRKFLKNFNIGPRKIGTYILTYTGCSTQLLLIKRYICI
jgi:hypothetical protein